MDWAVDPTAIDCVGGPPESVEAAKYKGFGCRSTNLALSPGNYQFLNVIIIIHTEKWITLKNWKEVAWRRG